MQADTRVYRCVHKACMFPLNRVYFYQEMLAMSSPSDAKLTPTFAVCYELCTRASTRIFGDSPNLGHWPPPSEFWPLTPKSRPLSQWSPPHRSSETMASENSHLNVINCVLKLDEILHRWRSKLVAPLRSLLLGSTHTQQFFSASFLR